MRKKVDERIRTLISNGVKNRHRSMFVIVGDKSRDQIVNLHYMLSNEVKKSRPTVLWCYKDKLELSSHKKKRAKQVKKLMQRGLLDPEKVDPFSLFVESGGLTYCLYKDSERVLGNTFGMCILQDFEALTPNLLARTIETVEGGGIIILLLRSLSSLTNLYTMVMDVHDRFRTESHSKATGRFNERFLLSIASCKACVVMDDELNILPISSHMRSIAPVPVKEDSEGISESQRELKDLKEQLSDSFPVGPLIKKCCTLDQGNAVATFLDTILDKTLRSTVALLAARGRGKSAALGLAIAGAIAAGYSNIFVTAPSPENLKTLFEFVCKGFDALEYKEHIDYDVQKSSDPLLKKATVQINIYKQHRQTIQYIRPHEHEKLSQVELLVVDEAAAIPLPVVKSLLGPYLVFLSSTVNGYEGTGRSLSLKLLQQLEEQSQMSAKGPISGRLFKKIELKESIRYASGDPIESWLHGLLCLDITNYIPKLNGLPAPSECDLYYVNRDTLFSYHKDSELFLQRMMALYVASHYKNSPNDLQLMADAPAHHLFVLLGPVDESKNQLPDILCVIQVCICPVDESKNQLPDILCVIQVCLEGQISRNSAKKSLSSTRNKKCGKNSSDTCGMTHVLCGRHSAALVGGTDTQNFWLFRLRYYEGQFAPISEVDVEDVVETVPVRVTEAAEKVSLLEESIKPRTDLPHLLVHLRERRPEKLHYIGVSFGLTLDLFRFWWKHKFVPFYIGHIPSAVTGEHTCMVLKSLKNDELEVNDFRPFYQDFRRRFLRLLGYSFRTTDYRLAMSIIDPKINFTEQEPKLPTVDGFLRSITDILSPHDMKRLGAYTSNLADFHMILDLVSTLSHLYFQEKLPVTLSYAQASILLCIGLQNQDISYIEGLMKLDRQQILSLFIKVMKKFHKYLYAIASEEIESTLPRPKETVLEPHKISVNDDLNEAARKVEDGMRSNMDGLNPELLQQYAIGDRDAELENALQNGGVKLPAGGVVSVKSSRNKMEEKGKQKSSHNSGEKRRKHEHGSNSKSNKKKKYSQ
ncbi:RNA cytidine acetyltransferase 1 [Prunus avium]|uniref:RNA cytidine acetyltransferase n=1 Tax=Prunus avium TaxID=42229 RepID=A0A6P5U3W4_PRUAV|nr:RNA cytidine acetyltransferase 1 [Prunus avium]